MKDFVYKNPDSLTPDFCIKIINLFENSKKNQYIGSMGKNNRVDQKIKDCIDLEITSCEQPEWKEIQQQLIQELEKNIFIYYNQLDPERNIFMFDSVHKNKSYNSFLIHKYEKNKGKYTYHNDLYVDFDSNRYRILNYLWYLNDVEEGGETEFFGNFLIKPKPGQMIIFPSDWTFPHTGKKPISQDKYVIAGWIYVHID